MLDYSDKFDPIFMIIVTGSCSNQSVCCIQFERMVVVFLDNIFSSMHTAGVSCRITIYAYLSTFENFPGVESVLFTIST